MFALAMVLIFPLTASADKSIKKLAKQLSKGTKNLDQKKLAILALPYHNNQYSSGSSVISERLTTQMVGMKGIAVVERRLLKQLLKEQHLSETGMIDSETANAIGKVLGVDAIVTGTLNDLDDGRTEVNARLIESASGEILAAAHVYVTRTWQDQPRSIWKPKPPPAQPGPLAADDPELQPADDVSDNEAAQPQGQSKPFVGNTRSLSNENFSPGRRLYHSNQPKRKKKRRYRIDRDDPYDRDGNRDDREPYQRDDEEFGDGYDQGYWDGYNESQKKSAKKAKKKVKNKKKMQKKKRSLKDRHRELNQHFRNSKY